MAAYRQSTAVEEYQIENLQCACSDCPKRQVGEDFHYFFKKANTQESEEQLMTQSEPPINYIGIVCGPCNNRLQGQDGRALATYQNEFHNNQQYEILFNKSGNDQEAPSSGKIIRSKIYCTECRTSESSLKETDDKIKGYASHGRETSLMAAEYYAKQQYLADEEQLRLLKNQWNQQCTQMKRCLILNKISKILRRYQRNQ